MTGPASKEPSSSTPEGKKEPQKPVEPAVQKRGVVAFLRENIWDTVAYILLFTGLILSIFYSLVGGLLVGLILGIYFSQEVVERASSFRSFIDREGIFRGFIVVAAVLALLIIAPGLLIGTLIGAWVRPFLGKAIHSPMDKPKSDK